MAATPPVFVPVVVQAPETVSHDLIPEITSLLSSLASLLWVVFAIVVVVIFREEIRNLLKKLKKGKLFGQEVEFEENLEQLRARAEEVKVQVEAESEVAPVQHGLVQQVDQGENSVDAILRGAPLAPIATLIILGREIEHAMRRALATVGVLNNRKSVPLSQGISELGRYGFLKDLIGSVQLFQRVRNSIVHGRVELNDADILSAVESGANILSALRSLPLSKHVVLATDIPIYSDPQCNNLRQGIHAVQLKGIGPDGASVTQIFPTTRRHFRVGMEVAWEWNLGLVTNESWYRDPQTGEILQGWSSAGEFVGRDLDEI